MERQDQSKNQIDAIELALRAQQARSLPSAQEVRRQPGWGLLMLDQQVSAPHRS